ncbi:[FeFe] hydrogenase H-cluster maturation GTPase HydF [Desulfosporosinus sp. BICA1-9]|uniref:[FeFe] hydrogenase H-cluster maturation GTPase HydF n=1 Tax=Desulfosporosinus sp. BICA1-9 TaxID=1531958 RepID=UPI00054BC805|nr:[FeFe] hydrogenase H-cluster maturation GTPase HydF [Desulfosporosinus sp. BICA1-9]KJS47553.1 MAG: ATP-binding protein [Peptococcaceae bacterium BRH_c23]KJS89270.1 MAG: ATP-binding protein [Desulfosporosinus sp. BICA1-9]HBW35411.1 [FeFe] hydrogenase H-cluster maturation GTPase HydF [Desulfosporosinus sp.]
MSLNETPRGVRIHLALFGLRNAGKSSVINAITGQETAIVSEVKGTTTDPVFKTMEILPIGPCVIIDTAGIDDVGELGELRLKKTLEVLDITDVALLIVDIKVGISNEDRLIMDRFKEKKKPLIVVLNKMDTLENGNKNKNEEEDEIEVEDREIRASSLQEELNTPVVAVSALKKQGIKELKNAIISVIPEAEDKFKIVGDLINPGDFVVLVTPIDKAAPKGRLILPQQQTIRDILESDAMAVVTKEYELRETLNNLVNKPKLVITDSQVFLKVAADTPKDVLMTSFSILFARQKGDLTEFIKGAKAIETLKDGDKVLIAEGCTHHRQSDDIGSVKIPRWIRQRTGKQIEFEFSAGITFTEDVKKYALIVHCGACMMNRTGMLSRVERAKDLKVPIVNFGILIAYIQGLLPRALEPFPLAKMILEEELS